MDAVREEKVEKRVTHPQSIPQQILDPKEPILSTSSWCQQSRPVRLHQGSQGSLGSPNNVEMSLTADLQYMLPSHRRIMICGSWTRNVSRGRT